MERHLIDSRRGKNVQLPLSDLQRQSIYSRLRLAELQAERMALWLPVKAKELKIEWHVSEREPEDLLANLAKTELVAREIAAGRFYKRPKFSCTLCDFVPVCLRDEQKIAKTLARSQ